jgi:hypothetical protein
LKIAWHFNAGYGINQRPRVPDGRLKQLWGVPSGVPLETSAKVFSYAEGVTEPPGVGASAVAAPTTGIRTKKGENPEGFAEFSSWRNGALKPVLQLLRGCVFFSLFRWCRPAGLNHRLGYFSSLRLK